MHEIATTRIIDIQEKAPQDMFEIGVKDWHNFVLANGILTLNCVHTITSRNWSWNGFIHQTS